MKIADLTSRRFALTTSIAFALGGATVRLIGQSVHMPGLSSGAIYIGTHLAISGLLIFGMYRREFYATALLTVVVLFSIFGAPYAFNAWLDGQANWIGVALVGVYSTLALIATPALIANTWRMWHARKKEEAA